MYKFEQSQYKSSLFNQNTIHGFGTKAYGDGRKNLRGFIQPRQTHGTTIELIDSIELANEYSLNPPSADGLITNISNITLSVVNADCVPIIYSDSSKGIIGITHGGWKGTLANISEIMVGKFKLMGSNARDIKAAIGPAIGSCCYEVSGDIASKFRSNFGNSIVNSFKIDLTRANHISLLRAGLSPANIDHGFFCTSCQKDEFWSYRRDGGIIGEMVTYVKLLNC